MARSTFVKLRQLSEFHEGDQNGTSIQLKRADNDSNVDNGSTLGAIEFKGMRGDSGGNSNNVGASIEAQATAVFDAVNPTRLIFRTTENGDGGSERLVVNADGHIDLPTDDTRLDFGSTNSVSLTHASDRGDGNGELVVNGHMRCDSDLDVDGSLNVDGNLVVAGTIDGGNQNWDNVGEIELDSLQVANDATNNSLQIKIADGAGQALLIKDSANNNYIICDTNSDQVEIGQKLVAEAEAQFDGTLTLSQDGHVVNFGVDGDVSLSHSHNQGLILECAESAATPSFAIRNDGQFGAGDIGRIDFDGKNNAGAGGNDVGYARIVGKIKDDTAGAEYGALIFKALQNSGDHVALDYNDTVEGKWRFNSDVCIYDGGYMGSQSEPNTLNLQSDGSVNVEQHNGDNVGLKLGGTVVSASATQLSYCNGVTSSIQDQLNAKEDGGSTDDLNAQQHRYASASDASNIQATVAGGYVLVEESVQVFINGLLGKFGDDWLWNDFGNSAQIDISDGSGSDDIQVYYMTRKSGTFSDAGNVTFS